MTHPSMLLLEGCQSVSHSLSGDEDDEDNSLDMEAEMDMPGATNSDGKRPWPVAFYTRFDLTMIFGVLKGCSLQYSTLLLSRHHLKLSMIAQS